MLSVWVDLFEHWEEENIMAQLTHRLVVNTLDSLECISQTREERLRALARTRAVLDYNTHIQAAREEGREEGMKTLLQGMIEMRYVPLSLRRDDFIPLLGGVAGWPDGVVGVVVWLGCFFKSEKHHPVSFAATPP